MARILQRLLKVIGLFAEDGDHPPAEFLKGSGLGDKSLKVIYGLTMDFPHLFAVFDQYFTIENFVYGDIKESASPKTFDIVVRIRVKVIKKDFPHIGKLIARLKGMLNFKATVFDNLNQPIFTMAFDGDRYLFSMRFRAHKDRLLVLNETPNITKETGVGFTDQGSQSFYMMYNFRLKIAGLNLTIEALKVNLDYYFYNFGANIKAGLRQPPKKVSAEGLVMGFLPIWLIDFFIPSNIDSMTQEFFQTLASGENGEGFNMLFGSIPGESLGDNLWFLTDAEVLSNGTMKFALNLQRKMVKDEDKLVEDLKKFEHQLWEAFYLDFLKIKSHNFCQPQ